MSVGHDEVVARIAAHLEQRDALVAAVRDGSRRVEDLLAPGPSDPLVESTRILVLLDAVPGASKVAARRRLEALGVDELACVGDLDSEVRRRLSEGVGER